MGGLPPSGAPAEEDKSVYDCDAGYHHYMHCLVESWSPAKIDYCCKNFHKGCKDSEPAWGSLGRWFTGLLFLARAVHTAREHGSSIIRRVDVLSLPLPCPSSIALLGAPTISKGDAVGVAYQ